MNESTGILVFDCVIAVPQYADQAILVNSVYKIEEAGGVIIEQSLKDIDAFDGCILADNLSDNSTVPKEPGIYKCQIRLEGSKSWTDYGYEYDSDLYLVNPVKIEIE